jgi:hypothetical protein
MQSPPVPDAPAGRAELMMLFGLILSTISLFVDMLQLGLAVGLPL